MFLVSEEQNLFSVVEGTPKTGVDTNANILRHRIEFQKATERFNSLLF